MSTWIYSAYLYDSGDYSDIQHTIYPDQVQSISIQCYKANGTKWGGPSEQEDSDEEFAYIIKTGKGVEVYFKYTSMNGKLISGDMNVC